ncbi:MAG: RDD family protein [Wolbachia endosymbiont of Menacanthus eurysternus]|nr:RDD family protein [Wolbachia endosymbiont of Menacanthus eurysternus]
MDTEISYAGILRRVLAFVIDYILAQGIGFIIGFIIGFTLTSFLSFDITEMTLGKVMIVQVIAFILELAFYTLMIIEFSGTPGQLLLRMRVKDKNTLKKITPMQAITRTVAFGVLYFVICYTLLNNLILSLVTLILVLVYAIGDEHKQAFHDKIAKTVVIDYRPS